MRVTCELMVYKYNLYIMHNIIIALADKIVQNLIELFLAFL